jgi:hypothetical protein
MGHVPSGPLPESRCFILRETARIARTQVLIFDYGLDGGWLIPFSEWVGRTVW